MSVLENRLATWAGILLSVAVAAPILRQHYRDFQEYRERKNTRPDNVVHLDPTWSRDIYDSTR